MKIELERFRVLPGKSERVDEWMKMLNTRLDECLATFDREQMYLEVIFREKQGEEEYLYWFSMQGEDGESVLTSEHQLDKDHIAFSRECIDTGYGGVDEQGRKIAGREMQLQVPMIPSRIAEAIAQMRRDRGEDGKMLA